MKPCDYDLGYRKIFLQDFIVYVDICNLFISEILTFVLNLFFV